MPSGLLIYPLVCFVAWIVMLYALLTLLRAPAVWNLRVSKGNVEAWINRESKVSANLSNQFEWPILYFAICVLLISQYQTVNPAYIWAAWIFLFGRVVHTGVQVLTDDTRLRGLVFMINFLAVLAMWFLYFVETVRVA